MGLLPAAELASDGTSGTLSPELLTQGDGATLSFQVNQTTAFLVHGSLANDHYNFIATITQLPNGQIVSQGTYSHVSRWLEWEAILYFGTGLDPTGFYNISLQNIGTEKYFAVNFIATITQLPNGQIVSQGTYSHVSRWLEWEAILYFGTGLDPTGFYNISLQNIGTEKYFAVRSLDLIQVPPSVTQTSQTPTPIAPHKGRTRSATAGIVVGAVFGGLLLSILGFILWRPRRKHRIRSWEATELIELDEPHHVVAPFPQSIHSSKGQADISQVSTPTTSVDVLAVTSSTPLFSTQEVDAGRIVTHPSPAPPGYNPAWQREP